MFGLQSDDNGDGDGGGGGGVLWEDLKTLLFAANAQQFGDNNATQMIYYTNRYFIKI